MRLRSLVSSMVTAVILLLFIFVGQEVFAGTNTFTESFVNQTYRDAAYTTALWNSGNYTLKLPVSSVSEQLNPSVALDGSNYVVVWVDKRAGGRNIYAAKYSSSGTKVWGDIKINTVSIGTPSSYEPTPKVECYGGYIYVLYASNQGSLRLQKHNSNGNLVWAVSAGSSDWIGYSVSSDKYYGYLYVAYTSNGSAYISKFNSSGSKIWGPVSAARSSAYDVSVGAYNNYVYVAHRDTAPGTSGRLDICKINPSTGAKSWSTDYNVGTGTKIRIGVDTYGNQCVVSNRNNSIYYSKINPNAYALVGSITVETGSTGLEKTDPEIAVGSGNIKYLTWLDKYNSAYGSDIRVKGQKFTSSDAIILPSGGIQMSHNDLSPQKTPSVCPVYSTSPSATNGLFVVWNDNASGYSNIMANTATGTARSWADDKCINNAPEYSSTAQGQSLVIDNVNDQVTAATLTYNTITSDNGTTTLNVFGQTYSLFGQTATFYLTNNGGTNWYQVTPGTKFNFPVMGSALKFKVVLSSASQSIQSQLEDLTITYDYSSDSTAPTGVPTVPTDQGTYINSTTLAFSWTKGTAADPESGIIGYFLQVATDTGFTNLKYNGDTGNVTSLNITSCTQGATYYARVRAKNGVGLYTAYSGASNGIKVDTSAPSGTPAIPTDAGTVSTSSTITFNWTAGTLADAESGIGGYWLQVSTDTTFATQFYNASVGNVTSKAISGTLTGNTYYARVRGMNGSGIYSAYSGSSNGILIQIPDTTPPTGTPSVPVDQGTVISSTSLIFTWTAGTSADPETGIVGYYLQVASNTGFTNLIFNGDVGDVLTKTVTNGVNGNTYYARIRAKNGAGLYGSYSGASNGITVQISGGSFIVYSDTAWSFPLHNLGEYYNKPNMTAALTVDPACTVSPAQGSTCTKFTFDKSINSSTGAYSLYNGWDGPGTDLTGNTKLTFKARADVAGVKLRLGMGLDYSGDTAVKDMPNCPITLSTTWTTYTLDLTGSNMSSINCFWFFTCYGPENPGTQVVFYIDDVRYTTASGLSAPGSADPSFVAGESYVFPNPAKEGKKPVIHVEVGVADKIEVYIYDVAGDLQDSMEITDTLNIVDGKYAYEYQWNPADKASGVYIARIMATKGSDKLKITKKFAVVK